MCFVSSFYGKFITSFCRPLRKPQEILGIVKVTDKGPRFDLKNNPFILFLIKMNKCKHDLKSDDTQTILNDLNCSHTADTALVLKDGCRPQGRYEGKSNMKSSRWFIRHFP